MDGVEGALTRHSIRIFIDGRLDSEHELNSERLVANQDPFYVGRSPWTSASSAGPSGPLAWHPDMMYNANGNITLRDDNTVAVFNGSTSHRCVYGSVGFSRGTHEWKITILNRPCCGYVGVAREGRLGTYDTFEDAR